MDPAKEKEVEDEYLSSLMDLNVNSKPLINMLTMLAEDNIECASVIVRAIEKHMSQVSSDVKLPILYLIDSIVKNVGDKYKQLFAQNIVNIFCGVFEKVNEKVREKMFNLRQTWNDVFPQTKLYALDVKVNIMDNNWPITAKVVPKSVHVNPNFLKKSKPPPAPVNAETQAKEDLLIQMQAKERELLELKQKKIELELRFAEQEISRGYNAPSTVASSTAGSGNVNSTRSIPPLMPPNLSNPPQGRIRIAPVSSAMISSARSRDPRLLKMRPQANVSNNMTQQTMPSMITGMPINTKSLPRIPKFSNSNNNKRDHDERERDPRKRREKEKEDSKMSSKSSKSSSSKSSSSNDRKKSNSDASPRKRSEEEKKSSSKGSSSHHKSSSSHRSHSSSKSPSKNGNNSGSESKSKEDIDLRVLPSIDTDMRPDSTTNNKYNKNKLLSELLNDEDMKSSQELMISTSNEESHEQLPKCDTDLRFLDAGKKRSISNDPNETEPTMKKNRTEDTLFGTEDVDLRALNDPAVVPEKKVKREKADFEAVRAKLNASKAKSRPGSIKILDEVPSMPITENGTSDLVRKILQKKKDGKEGDGSPASSNESPAELPSLAHIMSQPPPKIEEERREEIADFSSMTAAEIRKTSGVPASIQKPKRKESKWSQPTMPPTPWLSQTNRVQTNVPLPHHFINPWETNPMVVAMQKQSQMPLVIPQSIAQPILNNKLRTLRLDGTRDHLLRFYGEVAIIFNENGEAHDIKFSSGQSKVIIDDMYSAFLEFNDSYKPVMIDGIMHQIKFGTPTRELYLDDNFYECYFNNQLTQIILGDKVRRVRIEGKAPEVKIGNKRNDIVLGLINMMIDAEIMVPVFLDTTLQYFEYKGQIFTLQFADFFLSVVINNEPFKVEFGGLPKNYMLNGQKHFIRFTVLPDEITPGQINMRGMRRTHLFRNCKTPPLNDHSIVHNESVDITQLVENDMRVQPPQLNQMPPNNIPGIGSEASLPNLNINELLQKLVATGIIGNNTAGTSSPPPTTEKKDPSPDRSEPPPVISQIVEEKSKIIPVNLSRPETIKKRQQAIIDTLYCGIQCSSCGLRFPPEQTIKYSQHLDWHFRQNRRDRDSKRKAHSRKWYYNQSDWIKYEEIEDLDDREKNFFETQQMELMDQGGEDSNMGRSNQNQEVASINCPAGPNDVNRRCEMCHDQFETLYNDETEEWHLRNAIKIEDRFYHPLCYEDYNKPSQTADETGHNESANDTNFNEGDADMLEASVIVIKEEKLDDDNPKNEKVEQMNVDDDDVIVLPPEEPVITEIPDEVELDQPQKMEENAENAEKSEMDATLNATDDDVMIQEPKIETQIVNDDDDDDVNQCTSGETPLPLLVKIKEEPKDNGYEDVMNDEDPFVEVTSINEDLMADDAMTHSPFQPALDENAIFDESSLMMSNESLNNNFEHQQDSHDDYIDDEHHSRPESSGAFVGGNKNIKIVLSSLVQNNLTNKNINNNTNSNNVNNEQNDNSNIDSINKLDSNSVDLQKDGEERSSNCDENNTHDEIPSEIPYNIKPHLQGFKFEKNLVPVKRGIENSGLCSIM